MAIIGGTPESCGASWNPEDKCWLFPDGSCLVVPEWDKYIPNRDYRWRGLPFILIGAWLVLLVLIVILVWEKR